MDEGASRCALASFRGYLPGMTGNLLGSSTSSYLRSAAHQPIHWYPWGDQAFTAARQADKPILLDIGAVWCHWCHVMDGESYEDPGLARYLNEHFVCIKVDRDERPDVDARYQHAVQAITRQGGWPLTAFLTPGGEVFYGGTYFPPDGKYGRPGFRTVLGSVLDAYRSRREQVLAQAEAIRRLMDEHLDQAAPGEPSPALLDEAVGHMAAVFDPVHGGFGSQPKFPHPGAIAFLLQRWYDHPEDRIRRIIDGTLLGMARGGVHDQLGGGFHRYSVDAEWIVPHFEKMSYDNSELLRVYLDAYALFGTEEYAEAARGIVRWVREVASDPEGGYAASQDADVGLDDDGDYFTWTRDEAAAVLSTDELEVAAAYYDIGTAGEMHHNPGKNVLFVAASVAEIARRGRRPEDQVRALLRSARDRLRAAREQRSAPFVDRTRYANWNAMMVSAMLRAGAVLDDRWAREHALATLRRLRREAKEPDAVPHTPGGVTGLLEDQVHSAAAALDAHEATGDADWLAWAIQIMDRVWHDYRDEEAGGLFDTARGRSDEKTGLLPTRLKPVQDTPTPSPNGVAGVVCARLHALTGDPERRERAAELTRAFAGGAATLGLHGAAFLLALDWYLNPPTHLVIAGPAGDPAAEAFHYAALAGFAPRRVIQRVTAAELAGRALPPAVREIASTGQQPRGYACRGATCSLPAESLEAWRRTLASLRPARG